MIATLNPSALNLNPEPQPQPATPNPIPNSNPRPQTPTHKLQPENPKQFGEISLEALSKRKEEKEFPTIDESEVRSHPGEYF
jgi:hypothetical protein